MTMQITLEATNGVVFASDTKWTQDFTSRNYAVRHSFGGSKIRIGAEDRIAVLCAGDMQSAKVVADAIISDLQINAWSDAERAIQRIAFGALTHINGIFDMECIVGIALSVPKVYKFQFVNKSPSCQEIYKFAHSGDALNPAVFWSERYYKQLSLAKMKRLAAQVIVSAGQMNNSGVGGLEITYTAGEAWHRLSKVQNSEYEQSAKDFDKRISQLVFAKGGGK